MPRHPLESITMPGGGGLRRLASPRSPVFASGSLVALALCAAGCASASAGAPAGSPPASPVEGQVTARAASEPSPLIQVDATDVRFDGDCVGDVALLESEGKQHRVDLLFARVKDRRGANTSPLGGQLWFDLTRASSLPAIDALSSAAFAGGANTLVHVKTGRGWFDAHWDIPGRERAAARRLLVRVAREGVSLALESEDPCDVVPQPATLQVTALGPYLDSAAPERRPIDSIHLSAARGLPFAQVIEVLQTIGQHATSEPAVAMHVTGDDVKPLERTCGRPVPTGRLAQKAIQDVVRANFGSMRACYEDGLRRTPTLTGKVAVRFVIQRDGHVSEARVDDATSSMPDHAVSTCVSEVFGKLAFPAPHSGTVTVVYPIDFSPED